MYLCDHLVARPSISGELTMDDVIWQFLRGEIGPVNRAAKSWASASVVHDEQPHVGPILQEYVRLLESNANVEPLSKSAAQALGNWDFGAGKVSLSFANSHQAGGIQVADLVAVMCTRRLGSIIQGRMPRIAKRSATWALWPGKDSA